MKIKITLLVLAVFLGTVLISSLGEQALVLKSADGSKSTKSLGVDFSASVEKNVVQKNTLIEKVPEEVDSQLSLETFENEDLDRADMVYLLENLAYHSAPLSTKAAKLKIRSILETREVSEVMRFLPVTIHYDFKSAEKKQILSTFCRFEISNTNGFEALKVLLNKTPGFKNTDSNLDKICQGAV